MSYDDGSLGRRDDGAPADGQRRGPAAKPRSLVGRLVGHIRSHVRQWPRRYVEQQSALYESRSEK